MNRNIPDWMRRDFQDDYSQLLEECGHWDIKTWDVQDIHTLMFWLYARGYERARKDCSDYKYY